MALHGKLTALMCALALAIGLAACGGGGGSSGSNSASQRTEVAKAIETATDRILRLDDDASEADLEAAADAVAAARKALTDADALSAGDRDGFDTRITDLETSLERERKRIADAQRMQQMMTLEEARKLSAALSGDRISDIAAAVRHGAAPVMSGTAPGAPAVPVAGLETRPDGGALTVRGWQRGRYTAADADAGIEDTVVFHTNIELSGTRPFSGEGGKYGADVLDTDGNLPIVAAADATDTMPATDTTLIVASGFPSGPGIREHQAGPGGTVLVSGSFDRAPGTFVCTPTTGGACTSSIRSGGGYDLRGGWTFEPDPGATVPDPDGEHQYFGWWLRDTGGVYAVGAFHGGEGGAPDEFANLAALQGPATYRGPAAGQFAILREGGAAEAGAFEATATLEVDFGDGAATGTVSGEIDEFTVDGAAKDWSVALGSAAIGTHGTIASGGADTALTRWTIGDDTAETTAPWSGEFHDADRDSTPTVATGVFDAVHGAIGRMTGAFGTTRQ